MVVMNPVKVIIDNYPEEKKEEISAINNPEDEKSGIRKIPFSKYLFIEKDDFLELPIPKYFRLAPGREVRLRSAYIIKCEYVVKDPITNEIMEIHCSYDPETKSGMPQSNRKVKGTIHWVSMNHCKELEIRLYDRLFIKENPDETEQGKTFKDYMNPNSLRIVKGYAEPNIVNINASEKYQFERIGYFSVDYDSKPEKLILNRIVPLKDSWSKIEKEK